ncbi:MAG: dihydrofolate reductase [Defluviitaleaceae bacterium]|nr:dihydrofolate reductase [Defluviitaleaceae bacterium]
MNLIAAVTADWGIGYKNQLLFHIPEDLQYFKEKTTGKVVIMGHNTFLSLPNQRPLPNRKNIVLSRKAGLEINGAQVYNSLEALEAALKDYAPQDIFIIGGEQIYTQFLDRCDTAYVTKINASPTADAFFPNLDEIIGWEIVGEGAVEKSGGVEFRHIVYYNGRCSLNVQ